MSDPNPSQSRISSSTAALITVHDLDLTNDLMGHINVGDMAFLELCARLPTHDESVVFNAMLVSLVEHGITPSTLAARLTYLGAPESLQGAVAAGLLGLGTVFVGTIEGSARLLQESLAGDAGDDLDAISARVVDEFRRHKEPIPGLGHPVHKPLDPRAVRLFELARLHGLSGRYVELIQRVGKEAERQYARVLPVNVTGAVGALASEMGIPWQICRGLGLMARSIGIVGHLLEEMRKPMARDIWRRAEKKGTLPLEL